MSRECVHLLTHVRYWTVLREVENRWNEDGFLGILAETQLAVGVAAPDEQLTRDLGQGHAVSRPGGQQAQLFASHGLGGHFGRFVRIFGRFAHSELAVRVRAEGEKSAGLHRGQRVVLAACHQQNLRTYKEVL